MRIGVTLYTQAPNCTIRQHLHYPSVFIYPERQPWLGLSGFNRKSGFCDDDLLTVHRVKRIECVGIFWIISFLAVTKPDVLPVLPQHSDELKSKGRIEWLSESGYMGPKPSRTFPRGRGWSKNVPGFSLNANEVREPLVMRPGKLHVG